jgi:hypothetical protein
MQPTFLLLLASVFVLSYHTEESEENTCEVDMGNAKWYACRVPGTTLERCMPVHIIVCVYMCMCERVCVYVCVCVCVCMSISIHVLGTGPSIY